VFPLFDSYEAFGLVVAGEATTEVATVAHGSVEGELSLSLGPLQSRVLRFL